MADNSGKGFDVIMLNDPVIKAYLTRGWLEKITRKKIPNLRHINVRWETPIIEAREYSSPNFRGTTGIAYRKDLVPLKITSWKQYFLPDDRLKGKISVMEDVMDVTSMAMEAWVIQPIARTTMPIHNWKSYCKGKNPMSIVTNIYHLAKKSQWSPEKSGWPWPIVVMP